jgi:MFS family permease
LRLRTGARSTRAREGWLLLMKAAATGALPARQTVAILAATQILSWGSAYYAFSVLSAPMQHDLGIGPEAAVGAFAWALLVSGLAAAPVGRALDRHGGRAVMLAGSLGSGSAMLLLAAAQSAPLYWLAWTVLGVSMSLTLYEAAFATLNQAVAHSPRRAISAVTLFGGLASTIFWPLTLKIDAAIGWRGAWLAYAALQFGVCVPLHALLPRHAGARVPQAQHRRAGTGVRAALRHPAFWTLAAAFAANSLVGSALAVHLIGLMHGYGHALGDIVTLAALIGPMQVLGRLGEMSAGRQVQPRTIGLLAFATLPVALVVVLLFGGELAVVALFCMLFGLSNGVLTIVRGTLPQELFGREHYGAIAGALGAPAQVAKALGPLAVAALLGHGLQPRVVLAALLASSLASFACYLAALRSRTKDSEPHPLEHPVAVDQQVLQPAEGVHGDQHDQDPHRVLVHGVEQVGDVAVGRAPGRQVPAEKDHAALAVRGAEKAGYRQYDHACVQQPLDR